MLFESNRGVGWQVTGKSSFEGIVVRSPLRLGGMGDAGKDVGKGRSGFKARISFFKCLADHFKSFDHDDHAIKQNRPLQAAFPG